MTCDQCTFQSESKAALKRHTDSSHESIESNKKEMRNRIACDECGYKTTSTTVLSQHKKLNHVKKETTRKMTARIDCEKCNKRFNKESTYKTHMQKVHQTIVQNEAINSQGQSIPNKNKY